MAGRRRDKAVAGVTAVKTQLNQMPKRALTRAENEIGRGQRFWG